MRLTETFARLFRARPAPPPAPPAPPALAEFGYADPRRLFPGRQWATYNPSALVGSKGLAVFDEMLRDAQVKAALAFKKHACIATGWAVASPEGQPEDWAPTRFVRWALENLDHDEVGSVTLDADLYEILSALDFGFSVSEKVYEAIDDGAWQGFIGLRAIKTRAPHFIAFAQDVYGNLLDDGIIQPVNGSVPAGRLPRDKFVLFSYQSKFSNPFGTSDLEATYFPWWAKMNSMKWLCMLLEKLGVPPIFGMYQPAKYLHAGSTLVDDLKKILGNLQAATFGVIPRPDKDALEFWAPELAGQATRVFLPALEYFNNEISRSILMPNLIGMTQDQSQGSYARAKIHFDVFLLVVESIRKDLTTAMNAQIIRPLLDLNFPGLSVYPTWAFLPLTDDLRLELLKSWGDLVGQQVVTPQQEDEKFIRRMVRFPERRPGTEMPRPTAPANASA